MNTISRYLTGIIGLALGVFLIIVSSNSIMGLLYGLIIFIVSIFILFNNKEDSIEQIKYKPTKKVFSSKSSKSK